MSTAIWWIRRDLRLHDNPALQAALRAGAVVPLFILDPVLLRGAANARQDFLFGGLRRLEADLRARGSGLVVRRGRPEEVLAQAAAETGALSVHALEDYSPYARRRDDAAARAVPLRLTNGVTVHPPALVRKADGGAYTVFTPFSRAWKALPLTGGDARLPERLPELPVLESAALPELNSAGLFPPGEAEALRRLDDFLATRCGGYAEGRNRLDWEGTSALSPYLRFGMLSPRLAVNRALEMARAAGDAEIRRGVEAWVNELIWREFYHAILYNFPEVLKTAFNPGLRAIAWREDAAGLHAWQEGRTGFPVVDGCMRQLAATGWMHNRGRMITASFLVKDLLINWQEGERWFMRRLVDGDPAANNGGWQWTAGVGTDAAPYFRIFNPVLQGQKFDPRGDFVRKWVPELAAVPDAFIHSPWLMPEEQQRRLGMVIGKDYPAPIVDRAMARERTLRAYRGG
jgi:deoxyribodipyrimidine photo-lyase